MNRREQEIQIAIVQYLRLALGQRWLVFHPANEGMRSWVAGRKMKEMGVVAGMADIVVAGSVMVLTGRMPFHGFIEVKAKGKLTPAQRDFRDFCQVNGMPWACCGSPEEAEVALRSWRLPVKGALSTKRDGVTRELERKRHEAG
jgi:hypothetical protein